ncbi:DNA polymerase III subunit chi [Kerstersia gyiorum]|jgi:DNA polymerase-3 subunit chi|uniref:DNA polymerase III chi subunit n=1 Tax=Kerstersia gyiorum TaxID=206506 RepID=A0A171KVP5_9BURK|nr:DNA polymerase III subunit chi [Kerstersia gyiorum]AZV94607.1 DNA polymerase III subunit chi [Bordetella sp. J329]MCO7642313.1 DNA polymerase III subunit chi [Pseudomonas sp. S 311-6]KAB0541982.1 DNA polymerase III subunit chi [Kerstersia gyiorum]KKO72962.1 DNA polymerase III subunit chi [Kerstersia gyiorum]MCH4273045.1 DNA polymerase III subunit chi [Kerstersia gyiorum]
MARIDFAFGAADRLLVACQTVHRQYLAGRRLLVYCSDTQRLQAFDRLLWTFDDISFVPHVAINDPLAPQTPVLLTRSQPLPPPDSAESWLINLDDGCPQEYGHYTRILEFVSGSDADRQHARLRWRRYQDDGHELKAHDLSQR